MTTNLNITSPVSIVQRVLSTDDSLAPLALRLAGGVEFVEEGRDLVDFLQRIALLAAIMTGCEHQPALARGLRLAGAA